MSYKMTVQNVAAGLSVKQQNVGVVSALTGLMKICVLVGKKMSAKPVITKMNVPLGTATATNVCSTLKVVSKNASVTDTT